MSVPFKKKMRKRVSMIALTCRQINQMRTTLTSKTSPLTCLNHFPTQTAFLTLYLCRTWTPSKIFILLKRILNLKRARN